MAMQNRTTREHRQVFVYGENLRADIIAERCGRVNVLGLASLEGFRLDFFGHSARWDGAIESAVHDPKGTIHGVLYEMSFGDGERLDGYMDARLDGAGRHYHYPVEVVLENGTITDAVMYVLSTLGPSRSPSSEYLRHIVEGARWRKLPEPYVARLNARLSHPARYPVPRIDKQSLRAECGGCSDL